MKNLRDIITQSILASSRRHFIIEAGTGVGKSRLAITKIKQLFLSNCHILIVIPRNVLIENWQKEFKKWHCASLLPNVTFTTYVSFPKHIGYWDICIFDEAHHLSERCREAFSEYQFGYTIFLSATLKQEVRDFIFSQFPKSSIEEFRISTQQAINANILPDPQLWLLPLELDTVQPTCLWYPKKRYKSLPQNQLAIADYKNRWQYAKTRIPYAVRCTQRQYYRELSSLIEWYKQRNFNPIMRNQWLHKCNERLQWLSSIKLPFIQQILEKVHCRYVVFCNTIEESERLNIPAVNSKIGFSNLDKFNKGKINSLVAVNCLNEGINMTDCQLGVFCAINSSETMQIQKVGRILRHPSPIIIIPYFKATREEEIVCKWMQDYNPDLIRQLQHIDDIEQLML